MPVRGREKGAENRQWGMVVDTDRCTGCMGCVAACRQENNIPWAGPEEAAHGRSISWIRVRSHVEGEFPNLRTRFEPVFCQQCDEAPCVPVCPVSATYENREGLNAQVYARCVGVRFCAHACPYSAREFNWSEPEWPEPMERMLNPEVFVREKGMIEKCTFCVQRIRSGRERADREDRPLQDADVVPACAESCPSQALVFGDLSDPESAASRSAARPGAYRLLEETGAEPRVTYLQGPDQRKQAADGSSG